MITNVFRKKPVEIEARQLPRTADAPAAIAVYQWVESFIGSTQPAGDGAGYEPEATGVTIDPADGMLVIRTLEGDMKASPGDWIIRGVQGEFYPCKPDIFAATYEQVGDDERRTIEFTPEYEIAAARFFTASNRPDVVDLRGRIVALGAEIDRLVPGGRNKALALTALEDVQMRANRGVFAPEAHR